MQQGDPLGPLLFCLCIYSMVSNLESELCIWYFDDESIGGTADVVERDSERVRCEASFYISRVVTRCDGHFTILLGSPIMESLSRAITNRMDNLKVMEGRLRYLSSQDALLLLHHAFAIPKLLYLLRSAPCFFLGSTNLG